ncbi:VOC family protein [Gemmatimonas sp. UBA7669]|uniref:VOC family protein n=1 Tax=Gemmatimonas sp. UBA7669 TaxID=1946568 RepID=UPI0025BFA3D9|nr:VOC family protein [Gemmatimonas sp. UBA7669]
MFTGIDTIIIRVRDIAASQSWYTERLQAEVVYDDDEQRLAVVEFPGGSTLTLWQIDDGAEFVVSSTYPILATPDAAAAHATLSANGVQVEPLQETPGVIYFRFADIDGNPLEACQVRDDD